MSGAPVFDDAFRARFDDLLRWRRDVRHFRRDAVPEAVVRAILSSVAFAPSVGNSQPWRLVRVRSPALRAALAAHVDAAVIDAAPADAERRARYAALALHGLHDAPEIVAVFGDDDPVAGHGLGRATMPETVRYSTVMAIHTLWLAARVRGVGMGWVSILDPAHVTALLDVPERWTLTAVLCLGYPRADADAPELERRGWQAREPVAARIVER